MVPDLAVTLSQRRWTCIVDPALLLLTPFGPTLVQRLGELLDLWVVRSFWRVLDDSHTCLREPRRLVPVGWKSADDCGIDAVTRDALRAWERIRARSDVCGLRFRYIGDNLMTSALPEKREPDLVQRFEELEATLQGQLGKWDFSKSQEGFDAWLAAIDTIALSSTLGPAFILTMTRGDSPLPALAAALQHFDNGPEFQRVDSGWDPSSATTSSPSDNPPRRGNFRHDPLASLEREQVHRLLVQAGLSPLVWAGLELAVAHVVAPQTLQLRTPFDDMLGASEEALDATVGESVDVLGDGGNRYWRDARVFWYPL
jgi:hypothetical protein